MAPSPLLLTLLAVMCESILVGVYAVLTALVLWLLITKRRKMPKMHQVLFVASVAMFLISAVHLALVIQQNDTTTILKTNAQVQIIISVFQFVIGDLILIWRVWIVWERNYWVAGPPFAAMLVAASLTFKTASFQEFRSFFTVVPSALIVANTSICTILITGRIWYKRYRIRQISNGIMHSSGSVFNGTVALFIESGALYAAVQIVSLVLNHINSDGIHIVLDLEIPLIGILPTLIIVFVHFELSAISASQTSSVPLSRMQFQRSRDRANPDPSISSMATKTGIESEVKMHHYFPRNAGSSDHAYDTVA